MRTAYKVGIGGAAIGSFGGLMFLWAKQRYTACMKPHITDPTGAVVEAIVQPFLCTGPDIDVLFSRVIAVGGALVAAGGLTVGLIQGK